MLQPYFSDKQLERNNSDRSKQFGRLLRVCTKIQGEHLTNLA